MREAIGKGLYKFWDAIDVSENLRRMTDWVRAQPKDFISSIIIAVGSLFITYVCGLMAWKFDFESTYNALTVTREFVLGGVDLSKDLPEFPKTIRDFTLGETAILAITLFPTLMEIIGASMAKARISLVQLAVIGLSVFDVVTDIPTVTVFMLKHGAYFDQMGIIGSILYPFAFILWLLLATFAFELFFVIFLWAFISSTIRAVVAFQSGNIGFGLSGGSGQAK